LIFFWSFEISSQVGLL